MILLALDPSSTVTGYAVANTSLAVPITDAGILKPSRASDPAETRAASMAEQAVALAQQYGVTQIIIETPGAKVHARAKRGGGAGLALYGYAVGVMVGAFKALLALDPMLTVQTIRADVWTPRWTSKSRRAMAVAHEFRNRGYTMDADRGMDCADAIQLAQWWMAQNDPKEL